MSGVMPSITYINKRINTEDGDRFVTVEFFRGASIFNPAYAKTLGRDEAMGLIEKLRPYNALNRQDEENVIDLLKVGWNAYKQNASRVIGEFEFGSDDDEAAILSWHYKLFLRLENEKKEDRKKRSCRYCGNSSGTCRCYQGLHAWWFAARLCALVMPTSAAAERVFSLLNNLYSDQQTRTLVDSILLSLFLSYNNRKVIVPKIVNESSGDDSDSA